VSAGYELTPAARADLWDIWHYIGVKNFNPAAADRLWQDIEDACAELAQKPSLGHSRRDLTPDRKVLFYRVRDHYLVIYLRDTDPLQIARVLHGARDVKRELQAE
jgi:plasmid stabilization system protein ParE